MRRLKILYTNEGWPGVWDRASNALRWRLGLQTARPFGRLSSGILPNGSVLIVSGEPDTPGHVYRVDRLAQALSAFGYQCHVCNVWSVPANMGSFSNLAILWIWRAPHSRALERAVGLARAAGAVILYDCDDLMFEPKLATPEHIDAIRSGNYEAEAVAEHYRKIRRAMLLADGLTASTRPLAAAMRAHFRPIFVTPNSFSEETHANSMVAAASSAAVKDADILRIGYASGTLTHQKDFAQAAEGVAACLRRYPHVRLVLFRKSGTALLDEKEFPCLRGLEDRIEWRSFVGMDELPSEIARFDINLAPLEHGNRYVEAKSELKYFDAALVKVPTIASPTRPFMAAITEGVTGILARTPKDWEEALISLVESPELRCKMGEAAYLHVLAKFSPLARIRATQRCVAMMLGDKFTTASVFQSEITRQASTWSQPVCAESKNLFLYETGVAPQAAVAIPLYNYAAVVTEALDSVASQTLRDLELVIVDDASSDSSLDKAMNWADANKKRFCRISVLSNYKNSGLGMTRNRAVASAQSLYVLPLDADNKLEKNCVAELFAALQDSPAAFAYPFIQHFGDSAAQMGYHEWHPMLFACQNYIDAMALLNKSAWADVGGYDAERSGWEDYDFCCKLAGAGYWGLRVPTAKAFYRVHRTSMLRSFTEQDGTRGSIAQAFRNKHPWLDIAGY